MLQISTHNRGIGPPVRRLLSNYFDLLLTEQIVHLLLRQLILVNKADHWQVLRIGTLVQSADTRDLPIPSK